MTKDLETEGYLIRAKRITEEVVLILGYLPDSYKRTNARGDAESLLAWITKMLDELE